MAGTLAARRAIVEVCRRLYERGLIAGPDGNVSVRLSRDRALVTPTGMSKVDVRPGDLVEVTVDGGRPVRSGGGSRYRKPSSEVLLHVRMYSLRSDVWAVVHAHPPVATGFAVAGEGIPGNVLPETIVQMGDVALVPYALAGTDALADGIEPYVRAHDAFLLANHGAVTIGTTLLAAHQRMESLEHAARILLTSRLLGRVTTLSPAQVAELRSTQAAAAASTSRPGRPARSGRRGKE